MRPVPRFVGGVTLLLGIGKINSLILFAVDLHCMALKHFTLPVVCTAIIYFKLAFETHFRQWVDGNIVWKTVVYSVLYLKRANIALWIVQLF